MARIWVQLEDLTFKIARDAPSWRARGITLGRWGPTAESNMVVIDLRSPTAAAAQVLYDAYGADWITVSPEPFTQKFFFRPASNLQIRSSMCGASGPVQNSPRPRPYLYPLFMRVRRT